MVRMGKLIFRGNYRLPSLEEDALAKVNLICMSKIK